MVSTPEQTFDIAICGGSFVGLALARALTHLAPGAYRIAVIEQRSLSQAASTPQSNGDTRSVALTASVKTMLDALGLWDGLAAKAQPILRIELSDSSLDAPLRPTLVGLDATEAPDGKPTAYIVENADLHQALLASLEGVDAPHISWFAPDRVNTFDTHENAVRIELGSGARLTAKLLVAADGRTSALRAMADIRSMTWPSDKVGIVGTVGVEKPHDGTARQHFLPAGPFAILPMTGRRVSIVWTEEAETAARIVQMEPARLLEELSLRFGPDLGALTLQSKLQTYPLTMTLARAFAKPRFVLTGDAAHGLHWIAGQGLNHGLKDVAALSETLIDASRLGLDIGQLHVLQRYERWRRFDSTSSAFSAVALNTLFSNDNRAMRMARTMGLRLTDRIGPLKMLFMKEAANLTGDLPKLLKGLPI